MSDDDSDAAFVARVLAAFLVASVSETACRRLFARERQRRSRGAPNCAQQLEEAMRLRGYNFRPSRRRAA